MKHSLVLVCLAPLVACASSTLNVEDSAKPQPTEDIVYPDAKPDREPKTKPVAIRNQGFGPYDTLDLICGSGETKRCVMEQPVALPAGQDVLAVASFTEGRDGRALLAVQVRDGWYVNEVPDGKVFGTLSHHSPASTSFDLKHVRVSKNGFSIDRRYSMSSFYPGRGGDGATSFTDVRRLSCRLDGKVSCDEGKVLYSESCQTPMEGGQRTCETTGTEQPAF